MSGDSGFTGFFSSIFLRKDLLLSCKLEPSWAGTKKLRWESHLLTGKDILVQRKYSRILKFDSSKKAGELQRKEKKGRKKSLVTTWRLNSKFCDLVIFPGYLLPRISPSFTNIP